METTRQHTRRARAPLRAATALVALTLEAYWRTLPLHVLRGAR